jgi:hypothetical protein
MPAFATRIQADAMLGRHRELIGEPKAMLLSNPLNEWWYAQLIKALAWSVTAEDRPAVYPQGRCWPRDPSG